LLDGSCLLLLQEGADDGRSGVGGDGGGEGVASGVGGNWSGVGQGMQSSQAAGRSVSV